MKFGGKLKGHRRVRFCVKAWRELDLESDEEVLDHTDELLKQMTGNVSTRAYFVKSTRHMKEVTMIAVIRSCCM